MFNKKEPDNVQVDFSMFDLYLALLNSVNVNATGDMSGEDRLKICDEIIDGLEKRGIIDTGGI